LLAAGSAVVISDINEAGLEKVRSVLTRKFDQDRVETLRMDVTDYGAVEKGFEEVSCRLGGLDILVPNAGVAHVARIEDLDPEKFERVTAVNLKGTFNAIKAAIPIFKRQGTGGNIIVVSSKNVFDPGPAFGAYSASKAGAHQIGKIAALELAELGVRVNLVNPDAVFGDEEVPSKLWELVGPDRMKARGLDPKGLKEYYRQRNLLKVQVTAEHVGNAVVFFASEATPTTGATLPIDGGIPAAFPR
jgi:NAD(P)-dependent dehydrogenase (short-subunit alcohol dehydrogenase family)